MLSNGISDIISVIKSIKDEYFDNHSKKKAKLVVAPKRSISRLAMDAMAYFPCAIDDQCTLDEGTMIGRNLEKRYASFLLIVMSMDPQFDLDNDSTLGDYVRQFHQNMDVDGTVTPKFSLESITLDQLSEIAESMGIEYKMYATEESVNVFHTIYEGINSSGINRDASKLNFTIDDVTEQKTLNRIGNRNSIGGVSEAVAGRAEPILNSKFEKANDSVPTLLHIVVTSKNCPDGRDFVVGVKTTLHPINQDQIILNLVRGLKNEDKFFSFMRWTTGETKFFKDFLFGIEQLKIEAATSANSGNKMFNIGRRRSELSKIKNRFTKDNLMPNFTVIVTTDCLERLKGEYGYDITMDGGGSQVALVKKLMATYFMLGFVIVDQGLTRVHILIDGSNHFESYTYAGLQREGTVNDKQFKEMMKMLGRGGA